MTTGYTFYDGIPNPLLIEWSARTRDQWRAYDTWFKQEASTAGAKLQSVVRELDLPEAKGWLADGSAGSIAEMDRWMTAAARTRKLDARRDRDMAGHFGYGLFVSSFPGPDGETVVLDERTFYLCAVGGLYLGCVYRERLARAGLGSKWRRAKRQHTLSYGQMVLSMEKAGGELDLNLNLVLRVRHRFEHGGNLDLDALVDVDGVVRLHDAFYPKSAGRR